MVLVALLSVTSFFFWAQIPHLTSFSFSKTLPLSSARPEKNTNESKKDRKNRKSRKYRIYIQYNSTFQREILIPPIFQLLYICLTHSVALCPDAPYSSRVHWCLMGSLAYLPRCLVMCLVNPLSHIAP